MHPPIGREHRRRPDPAERNVDRRVGPPRAITARKTADELAGRSSPSDCQCAPSSNDTYTLRSVPAYSNPRRTGSSRTALTTSLGGIPSTTSLHVLPPSLVR